jgi:hypothetical protein
MIVIIRAITRRGGQMLAIVRVHGRVVKVAGGGGESVRGGIGGRGRSGGSRYWGEARFENGFDFEMFITIKEVRGRTGEVGAMGISFTIRR